MSIRDELGLLDLYDFYQLALGRTYTGKSTLDNTKILDGFVSYRFKEGEYEYVDYFSGLSRSSGIKIIYHQGNPVWSTHYVGVIKIKNKELRRNTYSFLRKALAVDNPGFMSARGPKSLKIGKWQYRYTQDGDFYDLYGFEEIFFDEKMLFTNRVIGGMITK